MLQFLRSASAGWVAKVLIALLVVSFAVFGVGNSILNSGGDVVASVGDTDVPVSRYTSELNREIQQVSQQLGQPLTLQQASLFGLPSQVLSRLVSEAALDNRADAYRMGLSDEQLIEILRADPLFAREAGFDRQRLQQILRDYQMTEEQYVSLYSKLARRRQLASAIVNDVAMPRAFLRAANEFSGEQRAVEYIQLTADQIDAVPAPSDAEITGYFDENKASYRAPEFRGVTLLGLQPQDLARPQDVTDADARQRYDATIDTFTAPERRQIQQIVVQGEDQIAELTALAAGGKLFSEIAAALNLTAADIDLGLKAQAEIIDKKVAEVAFGLRNGQVSDVVTGTFGTYLLKVAAIRPESVKSFEDVQDQIKLEMALRSAREELQDLFDSLENDRIGGASLAELADSYKLPLTEIAAVDQSGNDNDGNPVELPASGQLLQGIYASDVGVENNALPDGDGYVFFDVVDVEPARDRTLDEVRDKVVEAWTQSEIDSRLTAKASELEERLGGGVTIAQIAEELGLSVIEVQDITRANAAGSDLPAGALSQLFGGKAGHVAVLTGSETAGRYLVKVTAVTPAPTLEFNADREVQLERLSSNLSDNLLAQFIGQVQTSEGVDINQQLLEAVLQPQNQQPHGM